MSGISLCLGQIETLVEDFRNHFSSSWLKSHLAGDLVVGCPSTEAYITQSEDNAVRNHHVTLYNLACS